MAVAEERSGAGTDGERGASRAGRHVDAADRVDLEYDVGVF